MATATLIEGNLWSVVGDDGKTRKVAVPAGGGEAEALAAVAEVIAGPSAGAILTRAKASAMEATKGAIDGAARALTASYAAVEQSTWPQQEAAARAYDADGDSAAAEHLAMLDGLRALTARTRAQQATKIMTKVTAFRSAGASLVALREQAEDAITAATDTDDVDAALTALRTALAGM